MLTTLNRRTILKAGAASLAAGMLPSIARGASSKTIRAVMHAPLRATDPVINTAWTGRNHGLNIYDTLFAMDSKFQIRPQMVESHEVSSDGLTYTFVLRPGLAFHDGAPVTSADVIPSLQRWGKRDTMGGRMMGFVAELKPVDQRTFQIVLKSPYGQVLQTLAKPASIFPFIMPARLAQQPPEQPVTEFIGSGPFRFLPSEFQPGSRAAYERNPNYVPRAEAPDGLAGGKVVKIDRYEWISMPDMQTAANALSNGEIDFLEAPPHDLLPKLAQDNKLVVADYNPLGFMSVVRMNWLTEPFNRPEIRQALMYASDQVDWLEAQVGNPDYYQPSAAMFGPNTPFASETGWNGKPDLARAKELLKKGGYNGAPVVMMQGTDSPMLYGSSTVTAQKLRAIGMNVQVLTMDWGSILARRAKAEAATQGGWSVYHYVTTTADLMNPLTNTLIDTRGKASGIPGWPEDAEVEALRAKFAMEPSAEVQKSLADAIQARAYEVVTHIPGGLIKQPVCHAKALSGIVAAPAPLFWNVEKV
ncbi:ABC transporter substrate-binding protein [Rhodopseudomonas sp. AAP120]|uniref:ABC transporter substrate-binding protein n=1 Tax=Rhodopseudomonas sp. AAP120 TaxID=1523430 RepID=UPI0006B93C05|nr:ABC transporter substrate-binding protein [Rhodopseudomonas sp. AAP120]KPF96856.1 ABC transporter substrate-binding protein [Rhodopseudomonas sp. AAP120]